MAIGSQFILAPNSISLRLTVPMDKSGARSARFARLDSHGSFLFGGTPSLCFKGRSRGTATGLFLLFFSLFLGGGGGKAKARHTRNPKSVSFGIKKGVFDLLSSEFGARELGCIKGLRKLQRLGMGPSQFWFSHGPNGFTLSFLDPLDKGVF